VFVATRERVLVISQIVMVLSVHLVKVLSVQMVMVLSVQMVMVAVQMVMADVQMDMVWYCSIDPFVLLQYNIYYLSKVSSFSDFPFYKSVYMLPILTILLGHVHRQLQIEV